MTNNNNISCIIAEMDLTKLSKTELLAKCEELGIKTYKSKNKEKLIQLINNNKKATTIPFKKLIIEDDDTLLEKKEITLDEKKQHTLYQKTSVIKIDNLKLINQINQLFHNKGVKQDDRFNLLMLLLEKNKHNLQDDTHLDIQVLMNSLDYTNHELIQEIFMTIGSKYTKFNLDQFYSPLNISKFISHFMNPSDNNNAIDPAGGTGDLLLFYNGNKTVWDIDENALKLCKFNYELNKQSNYTLVCKNSLANYEEGESKYTYSVMNPPFGSNTIVTDAKILNKFELSKGKPKQEIGILFLELGLKLLKENGILFIIVPAGYVGNGNKTCSEMRDLILKNRLIASVLLPENTFKRSGTGVNTYLLIIQKKTVFVSPQPYNILISKINNIGYNLSKKETPLKYKIIKETGELILDPTGSPVLDNDLDNLHKSLCSFINDNNIECFRTLNITTEYEYISTNDLVLNILDIKRYLQSYLCIVNKLKSLNAVSLKSLCKLITNTTKIKQNELYKYIDISEINSPLYGYKLLYGWELPSRAKYTLKKYDILVSKLEGNMSCCVILDDNDNYIATNGVSVIRPNNLNALYILFSNIMSYNFRCQHNAYLTGSIMASLSDSDIEEFLIDNNLIDIETTKKILETLETLQKLRI